MIEKYTISFSVEADVEDKEELTALIWTLLKSGKQAYGPMPMTVPSLKEINVEVDRSDEPYQPFRLFLLSHPGAAIPKDMTPTCTAEHFHELKDAIADYKAQGKVIAVHYVPKETQPCPAIYYYDPESGAYKDYPFLQRHPYLK